MADSWNCRGLVAQQILNFLAHMPHQMHYPTRFLLCQNQHFRNDWHHFPHINFHFDCLAQHDQAGCLRCRHLQCGVAFRVSTQWLKYLSNAPFFFLLRSIFALALGLFWLPLNIFGLCFLVFDSWYLAYCYRQNIFLNKYPKFDCTKHLPITIYSAVHVEVENGYSENRLIEHRLKE